jgi:putative alpha-1,2-mannosidase
VRLTFSEHSRPYIAIQVTRAGHEGKVTIDPIKKEIYGWNPERQDSNLGPDKAEHFKGFFYAKFDDDITFEAYGTAYNDTLTYNECNGNGELLSAFVQFPQGTRRIQLRMGISYISIDQAKQNLEQEIPSSKTFEDVAEYTWSEWSEKLDAITLYNATIDQLEIFYTAMFHALQVRVQSFHRLRSHIAI